MKFIPWLLTLLMACGMPAKDLYRIQPLSEEATVQMYQQTLETACQYADKAWTNSAFDPAAGYWGDGVSAGNEGVRTIASMVMGCGALLKYDQQLGAAERRDLSDKIIAALRYTMATHISGQQKCMDGKQWGGLDRDGSPAWQSSMWTSSLAWGAWLVWDRLDPALQNDVHRVVAAQNDFMIRGNPPVGLWSDTKAEENGWDIACLALGELMFPHDPHVAAWHDHAREYMMNTLCTAADLQDTNLVDGRAVNQWVLGPNLQLDFTLENHGIFHPSYVGCSCYFMTQAAMYYTYAGRSVPQAARHHLLDTWHMFQTILLPWGEAAYPQGMDWELHGLPFIDLYGSLATREQDPFAARMEQCILQYMRDWQIKGQGSLSFPGSNFGIARHAINIELITYGYLAHKIFGPAVPGLDEHAALAQEEGVWEYPYVQFIEHRTAKKFTSFSWKNRIMGQVIPLGMGHMDNPFFTVPMLNGLVGSFELPRRNPSETTVVEHSWKQMPDGFTTSGTLRLDGGRLKQVLTVVSVGDQTVVYADRVTAMADVIVKAEAGVPLGIENDEISSGQRIVFDAAGQTCCDWQKPAPAFAIPGSWANVDSRLGMVMVAGSGMTYAPAHKYTPGISVYEDVLYGSYNDHPRKFKAGEEVARRIVILCTETSPDETAALAKSCRVEDKPGGQVVHFKQPDGREATVSLDE